VSVPPASGRLRSLALLLIATGALAVAAAMPATAGASFFEPAALERLAPVVVFHPDEKDHPSSGEEFLDHAGLAFGHDGCRPEYRHLRIKDGQENPWGPAEIEALGKGGFVARLRSSGSQGCKPLPGPGNLFSTSELTRPHERNRAPALRSEDGWYLDLADSSRGGFPDQVPGDGWYQTAAPTYYDDGLLYTRGRPNGYAFVTYWFFYDYNDGFGPQNHEGDWENVSIRLKPLGDGAWEPIEVFYARHGRGTEPLLWSLAPTVTVEGAKRLQVLAAKGSHASYPRPPHNIYDRTNERGPRWATWLGLSFLWDQRWAGYCGAWGRIGTISDTTGPLGPGCLNEEGRLAKTGRPAAWGTSQARSGLVAGGNSIVLGP
jgi:hypothetical protein